MPADEILFEAEEKMEKAVEVLLNEFKGVRTGRATPGLVENIKVEYYDHHNRLFKEALFGGFEQIKDVETVTKMMIEQPKKKSRTHLQYFDIDYDTGLPDSLFEQSNLKR